LHDQGAKMIRQRAFAAMVVCMITISCVPLTAGDLHR
jgi:hypothetical protein